MANSNQWLSHSQNGTPLILTMPQLPHPNWNLDQRVVICLCENLSIFTGAMGSGGSKKTNLDVAYNPDRRPSQHELTNPPTESRG